MKEAALLRAVDRIVGRIQVEYDFRRRCRIRLEKHVHAQPSSAMKQTISWLVTVERGLTDFRRATTSCTGVCPRGDSRIVVVEPALDLLGPLFAGLHERFLLPCALVSGKRGE